MIRAFDLALNLIANLERATATGTTDDVCEALAAIESSAYLDSFGHFNPEMQGYAISAALTAVCRVRDDRTHLAAMVHRQTRTAAALVATYA